MYERWELVMAAGVSRAEVRVAFLLKAGEKR